MTVCHLRCSLPTFYRLFQSTRQRCKGTGLMRRLFFLVVLDAVPVPFEATPPDGYRLSVQGVLAFLPEFVGIFYSSKKGGRFHSVMLIRSSWTTPWLDFVWCEAVYLRIFCGVSLFCRRGLSSSLDPGCEPDVFPRGYFDWWRRAPMAKWSPSWPGAPSSSYYWRHLCFFTVSPHPPPPPPDLF